MTYIWLHVVKQTPAEWFLFRWIRKHKAREKFQIFWYDIIGIIIKASMLRLNALLTEAATGGAL